MMISDAVRQSVTRVGYLIVVLEIKNLIQPIDLLRLQVDLHVDQ